MKTLRLRLVMAWTLNVDVRAWVWLRPGLALSPSMNSGLGPAFKYTK